MGLARLERAQLGAAAGRGCARTVRAGSPTPAARSGTLKRADLSSSRCELDVTAPFHRRTKNSIWGLLACEPEHLLAQVHRPSLRSESRHLVMSQLWPLLRARSRRARHGHLHLHAGADRRLPGGGGRVAGDAERLCARAHGRSALPGTGRAVVPGGVSDRGTGRPTVGLGLHKGKSGSFYQWFPLWKVPGTSPFPVAPGTGN